MANLPVGATDGQSDLFTLTATATDKGTSTPVVQDRTQGLTGVNTAFADAASNSTFRAAIEIDAAFYAQDVHETRLEIRAPMVLATKTSVILDAGLKLHPRQVETAIIFLVDIVSGNLE